MSSYGAVKYKSGFKPTPGSSTRGPTPCSVAGSKMGACMTLSGLLLKELVDVRIPSGRVGGAAEDKALEPGHDIVRGGRHGHDDARQLFRPPRVEIGRALHGAD